jgi:hypothetical protein
LLIVKNNNQNESTIKWSNNQKNKFYKKNKIFLKAKVKHLESLHKKIVIEIKKFTIKVKKKIKMNF